MNKNKVVGLALASALLVGGTFAGTKAWFTDVVETDTNLEISTGDLDIKQEEYQGWKLHTYRGEFNIKGNDEKLKSIQPGDRLTKIITIKNVGEIDAKINLSKIEGAITGSAAKAFSYSAEIMDGEDDNIYQPNLALNVKLTVTMNSAPGQHNVNVSPNYNTDTIANSKLNIGSLYKVEARQAEEAMQ